ncbi:MAG TPA: transmembrane 220 family protein [Chitinophagaceae bacterium]|nr:transmembrane 220 family protein [Chitinophagaceae bacterium]
MKILNLVLCILFVIFAGLQYNDPDPFIWIPIYLFAAFLCWRAYKGIYHRSLLILAIVIYLLYAIYLFFDTNGVISWASDHAAESIVQTMKAEKPWIEETREFGGLVILIVAMAINLISDRKIVR